ncbi:MAG: DUF3466 family protein [Opitutaceae bacterium]|nr:DUF3466 family protein [Opitutaceae bacterium]
MIASVRTSLPRFIGSAGLPLTALLLATPALAQTPPRYTITNLGTFGGANTTPLAINANGVVVGYEWFNSRFHRPFVYRNGTMTEIGSYGDAFTEATGVNATGTIVVSSLDSSGNTFQSFSYTGTTASPLANLGGSKGMSVAAINDAGVMVGYGYTANNLGIRAFSIAGGTLTNLGTLTNGASYATAINSAGVIVGYSDAAGGRHAVRYSGGTVTDLGTLGGPESFAYGINNSGVIVGSSGAIPGNVAILRAFVYANGTMTNIDTLGAASSALGINSAGTVVGVYGTNPNVPDRGFVYTPATGMIDLNTAVVNLAASGFTQLLEATAINDSGQIVGRGRVGNGFRGYLLTPSAAPVITTHPLSHTVAPGSSVVFSVTVTGTALQYQWFFNNAAITGATSATHAIASAAAAHAGIYTVRVSSGGESVTSNPATLTVTPGVTSRLINLSILTSLAGASDSFTMGYVVGGAGTAGSKPLVIRAAGPSLAVAPFNVPGALTDPKLEFFSGTTRSGENDNWGGATDLTNAMAAVGAFPFTAANSRDAAALASAAAGNNSVVVSPVGNLSGTVIAELYDASPAATFTAATPRLINVSVLKGLGTGLTAGFVVGGTASRTVLIRAVGPTLGAAPFNVPGVVVDPQLTLFSGQTQIGANDNWGDGAALSAAFTQVGAFALPAASRDAALLITLAPGNYSVQVSGVGATTGVAIVEVYEVP